MGKIRNRDRSGSPGQGDRGGKYRKSNRFRAYTGRKKQDWNRRWRIYEQTYTGEPVRKRRDPETGEWIVVESA